MIEDASNQIIGRLCLCLLYSSRCRIDTDKRSHRRSGDLDVRCELSIFQITQLSSQKKAFVGELRECENNLNGTVSRNVSGKYPEDKIYTYNTAHPKASPISHALPR